MVDPFFNERSDQSEVKAAIIHDYFFAWANVIKATAKRFHNNKIAYIDLFAGPGRYKDGAKSTPLLVLERVANDPDLSKMLVSIFNDEEPTHADSLRNEVQNIKGVEKLRFKPVIENGDAGGYIGKWMQETKLVPTFSFIDPFGYRGLSLGLIQGAIKDWGCDCVFFLQLQSHKCRSSQSGSWPSYGCLVRS
ncbi:three-Cys-motif partner protein TcmP [Oleisolibacter albus]|uniref:three-Cys-motif partner protein TcmP n=1 Tax=Oleisolibacter albus TaxID=2171757 RepID=UPI0019613331|nr:three-Cys-motif partner protein TcmP [Oleisolibacter albus]